MKVGFQLRPRGNNPTAAGRPPGGGTKATKAHMFDIIVKDAGSWSPWTPLSSGNLGAVRYHDGDHLLQIEFRSGLTYTYLNVPYHVYSGVLQAGSPGKYFHTAIRTAFTAVKAE